MGQSKYISWDRNLFRLCRSMAQRGRQQCTVYDHTCASYHKTGHFTKVCRSKMTQHGPGQKHISPNAIWLYLQQDTLKQMQMYAMTHRLGGNLPNHRSTGIILNGHKKHQNIARFRSRDNSSREGDPCMS